MQLKEFGVSLGDLIHEFNFEVVYGPEGFEKIEITKDDVNRPGLQLAGFFDYFDPNRIQVMGKVESSYVEQMESEERRACFDRLFETRIPVLLITRNIELFPECVAAAQQYGVPILRTNDFTSTTINALVASLRVQLAPRVTLHGVLIEIYGEGVLLLGDSGVGKSETAIELVKRGHRLIADDAVEIKRVSDKTLVGTAPEVIRHFIELRGIGIVDVRRIFGIGAIKMTEKVELVINLEPWEDGKAYDRLGLTEETLGVRVIAVGVPMVVYASTIARDAMARLMEEYHVDSGDHSEAAGRLLQQVADGFLGNMVVTPREIDEMVLSVADLLSEGLNRALQPSLDEETLHTYLHA